MADVKLLSMQDGLQRLHDLLYTAQVSKGLAQNAAIGQARLVLYRLREGAANAPAVPDSCVPAGWVTLSADQWATIFNSNNAWYGYTKPEAIDEAVKMTESMLMRNNAASHQPQPVQPSNCEWTNCPRRVGDVCCNEQAKPEQAAQPLTEHKQGCDALGGYGHGIGACSCGFVSAAPRPKD